MPNLAPSNFIRLISDPEKRRFYQSLLGQTWWDEGGQKNWVKTFEEYKWKCVYCDRDLATSTDALAESTEEHLVPRSLLEANGVDANSMGNMAACCAGCNGLKNEWIPPASDRCWETRESYVVECRRFVARQRFENFTKYRSHVEKVLKERAGL